MHSIFKTTTNNGTEKISMRKLFPKCVLVKFCMFKNVWRQKGFVDLKPTDPDGMPNCKLPDSCSW